MKLVRRLRRWWLLVSGRQRRPGWDRVTMRPTTANPARWNVVMWKARPMTGRSLLHRINDRDEANAFWRALQSDPVFIAGMAGAAAERAQGRFGPFIHKHPRPTCSCDGPDRGYGLGVWCVIHNDDPRRAGPGY